MPTLLELIDDGLIDPGEQEVVASYKGSALTANLTRDGAIVYGCEWGSAQGCNRMCVQRQQHNNQHATAAAQQTMNGLCRAGSMQTCAIVSAFDMVEHSRLHLPGLRWTKGSRVLTHPVWWFSRQLHTTMWHEC
jgi:hypothetical protein